MPKAEDIEFTLFLPLLNDVITWAGFASSIVGQYTMPVRQGVLDDSLPDPHTLRKAFVPGRKLRRDVLLKFHAIDDTLTRATGAVQYASAGEEPHGPVFSYWSQWFDFALRGDNIIPIIELPFTRRYLAKVALEERDLMKSMLEQSPGGRVQVLLNHSFVRRLCTSEELVVEPLKQAVCKSPKLLQKNHLFRRWKAHCRVSVLMDILAAADLEFCDGFKDHSAFSGRDISFFAPILPTGNRYTSPVWRLLKRWRDFVSDKSWGQFAERLAGYADPENTRTSISRWKKGTVIPNVDTFQAFLRDHIPHADVRRTARIRMHMAVLMANLYKDVLKIAPKTTHSERLLMFATFKRHRARHQRSGG